MAEETIFGHIYQTSEGHDISWEHSADSLQLLQSKPFQMAYRTFCTTSPSAWNIRISITDLKDDGTCSLSAWCQRVDSLDRALEAAIWVDICDSNGILIFDKATLDSAGMLQGDVLQRTVQMMARPSMRAAVNRNAVKMIITFMICFCHSESESSELNESD